MITIIFGPPRIGKTAFMVYKLNEACFDYERNRAMQRSLELKNQNGFNLTIPKHCVSANFDVTFAKQGYYKRKARHINPYRLGFANDECKVHFSLPYESIGIMEAQKYFNSRLFRNFRDWQSRYYEQHGHNHMNILMDTQRPGLIDPNLRELSNFIEIRNLDVDYTSNGFFEKATWTIREFDDVFCLEKYFSSGKKDRSCYVEKKVVSYDNVFEMYDSFNCEPKFYEGHFDEDFDIKISSQPGESKEEYKRYLEFYDDDMPKELRKKGA